METSTWLTKQQAADAIGVTTKTVERWAQAGKLQQGTRRRTDGGPEIVVYHPDDVARLAKERQQEAAPFVLPVGSNGSNGDHGGDQLVTSGDQLVTRTGDEQLRALFAAAVQLAMSQTSQTPTLFLTLAEASAVSGLSVSCLRRLITDKTLKAVRDRGWRIRRRDLEQL